MSKSQSENEERNGVHKMPDLFSGRGAIMLLLELPVGVACVLDGLSACVLIIIIHQVLGIYILHTHKYTKIN